MAVEALFTQSLGLTAPWKVVSAEFDPAAKSLELVIDFEPGSRFPDPESGESCPVHDTVERTWQHLHERHNSSAARYASDGIIVRRSGA